MASGGDKYFLLDEKSRRLLQNLLDRERRRGVQPQIKQDSERSFDSGDASTSREIYLALSPAIGIPALTGFTPGKGECVVYRLDQETETLEEAPRESITVYNLGEEAIPASVFIGVWRDKFGTWFAEGSGTGMGTGTGTAEGECHEIDVVVDVSFNSLTCELTKTFETIRYRACT